MTLQQQTAFENIVGKGEIARDEQFLFFPQCFLLNQMIVSLFVHIFDIISLFAAELEEPEFGLTGKGLISGVAQTSGIGVHYLFESHSSLSAQISKQGAIRTRNFQILCQNLECQVLCHVYTVYKTTKMWTNPNSRQL